MEMGMYVTQYAKSENSIHNNELVTLASKVQQHKKKFRIGAKET